MRCSVRGPVASAGVWLRVTESEIIANLVGWRKTVFLFDFIYRDHFSPRNSIVKLNKTSQSPVRL